MNPRQRLAAFFADSADAPRAPVLDLGGPLGSLPARLHRLVRRELSLPPEAGRPEAGWGEAQRRRADPLLLRLGLAAPEEDLLERFGAGAVWACLDGPGTPPKIGRDGGDSYQDFWGAGLVRPPDAEAYRPFWAPLAKATGPSDFRGHRFPVFDGACDERWGRAAERAGGRALCVAARGILEVAGDLVGRGRLEADLGRGGALASEIAARVAEVQLTGLGRLASVVGAEAAVVVTVDEAGGRGPDFRSAQGALFRHQATVVGTLAALGLPRAAVFGRSPESIPVLRDLGAAAVMVPGLIGAGPDAASGPGGGTGPGTWPRRLWSGPSPRTLSAGDPGAVWRAASEAFGRWLADRPLGPLSPWLAADPDSDPAALAKVLEAAAALAG